MYIILTHKDNKDHFFEVHISVQDLIELNKEADEKNLSITEYIKGCIEIGRGL